MIEKYQEIIDNIVFEEDGIEVKIAKETWCEHCDKLTPYTAVIDFDGICYCLDCSRGDVELTEEELFAIDVVETEFMYQYHLEIVQNLARHRDKLKVLNSNESV